MIPIKDILKSKPVEWRPPVLVIDEAAIRTFHDAGPVCECCQRYHAVRNYKPFLVGGINPYVKEKYIPDRECLEPVWVDKIAEHENRNFDRVFALLKSELPPSYRPKYPTMEQLMLLQRPDYD